MPLKPFPIYDYRSGMKIARKPWITPVDAFTTMTNAFPFRGRILKRPGTRVFGELGILAAVHNVTGSAGQTSITHAMGGAIGPVVRYPELMFSGSGGAQLFVDVDGRVRQRLLFGAAAPEWEPTGSKTFVVNAGESIVRGTFTAIDTGIGGELQRVSFDREGNPSGSYDHTKPATIDYATGVVMFTLLAVPNSLTVSFEHVDAINYRMGDPEVSKEDVNGLTQYMLSLYAIFRDMDGDGQYDVIINGTHEKAFFRYPDGAPLGNAHPIGSSIQPQNGLLFIVFQSGTLDSFRGHVNGLRAYVHPDPHIVAGGNKTWSLFGPGPLVPGHFQALSTGGTAAIGFDADGVVTGDDYDPAGPNWIDHEKGVAVVTFLLDPGATSGSIAWYDVGWFDHDTGTFAWELYAPSAANWTCVPVKRPMTVTGGADPNNTVMHIINFFPESGGEFLYAFDRRRLWSWDGTKFVVKLAADFWDAEPNDFYWTLPARLLADAAKNVMLICNPKNILTYFDGTALKEVHTDWRTVPAIGAAQQPPDPLTGTPVVGSSYIRQIDSAKIALMHPRNRIVLFGTTEGGTLFGRRARWSEVNAYVDYTPGGVAGDQQWFPLEYEDAQTEDEIASAGLLGNDIYVWFRGKASGGGSLWRLVWQDDFRQPFRWEMVAQFEGGYAPKSTVQIQGSIVATMSATQYVATDGRTVQPIDADIPDFLTRAAPDALDMAFAIQATELRSALVTIPLGDAAYPDHIMAFQFEDKAWALWRFSAHCFGPYRFTGTPTPWDSVPGTWEQNRIFDEVSQRAGYPTVLMGDRMMRIHILNAGHDDEIAGHIMTQCRTGELNPYREGMLNARLAQIDFICQPQPGEEIIVTLRGGFREVAYAQHKLDLTPTETDARHVKRTIIVNESSSFHTIEVENFDAIDAVIPWFEEDGDIREIG